jgi:Family of unknown function (DUF6701)
MSYSEQKHRSFVWKINFFFILLPVVFLISPAYAAISTVASEQSGTTSTGVVGHVGTGGLASRNNCGNITPAMPAGSVGDLLIAVAVIRENTTNVTMPGWTQYYSGYHGVDGNQDLGGYIFYRVATSVGADPNTITSASTGGPGNCQSLRGQISRFNNVDPASPFETDPIVAGNSSTQNTNTVITGTETTTSAIAMLIAATFINDNATVTEADGFSQSFDSASAANRDSAISLNYRQESAAGAKGAFTWAQNLGTDESIGVLFALSPDPASEGITINVPTGTAANDVMLAAISVRPSTTIITAPTGWTLLNRVDQGAGNSNSQAIYHRTATTSEPASYIWSFSGGAITGTAGGIISYRGVDTASVIDASGGNVTASSTSHQANSIVTTVANTMVVSTHSFSSAQTWTEPAGMTEQVDIASLTPPNGAGISLEMNDVIQPTAGATGNKIAVAAGSADTGVAQIVALTPIVISGGITVTFAGGPIQRILAGSISVTDAALGTPEASANNFNVGNSAAITTNITTIADNALLIDIVGKPRGDHTYSQPITQTERWDNELGNNNNGATGAMSTKLVVTAGATSMTQTHTSATRRNVHAVTSIAPIDSSSTATFDAFASATANNANNINWAHTLSTSNTLNTKMIVGVTYRDNGACGPESISSITFGNYVLTQITATSVFDGSRCQYSELWYVDLTNIIVSTNNNSTLGGQAIDQDEAVEYDASTDTGTLFFDDATFNANERLTGLHLYANGNVALATASNANIGGNPFQDDDIVEVTPSGTAGVYDFVQVIFDGGTHFTNANERIDAVYVRNNGNIILSTQANAGLPRCPSAGGGTLNFIDDDLVEWDPINTCATMFLDESATGNLIPNAGGDEDIVGVHLLNDDDDLILFSLVSNNTIRGTAVLDGDVVLYDRANDTASIFFSEANFTSGGEDIDALTLSRVIITDQVDHYEITYPNGAIGITCEASQITITAHDIANNAVNVLGGTILTINSYIDGTTTNTGILDNATGGGVLAGNPGNPVTYTWPSGTEESSVTLELRQLTPETIDVDLTDTNGDAERGDGDNSDPEDPEIEFRDAVFRVVDNTNTPVSITTKLSGKQSNTAGIGFQDLYLQAIETTDSLECQGVFESENDVSVEMAFECDDPTSCETVEVEVEDDSSTLIPIDDNPNGSVTTYQAVQFDFDADSKTPLRFVYDDAGQITLHARYDIDSPNGVYMSGMSNSFTVRPAGICVESLDANSTCPSADPNNADCSTPFRKAGSVDAENFFNLTVRGVTWDSVDGDGDTDFCTAGGTGNVTTPNFELSNIALTSTLVAPTPGGTNATLGVPSIDIVDADNGANVEANQSMSEVGVFTITATPVVLSYFGETIAAATSVNIGRFYPDRFNVTMQNVPAFANSCTSFTYLHQPFYYGTAPILQIEALNSNGNTTNNYGGDFWRLTTSTLPRNYADGSGTPPAASFSSMTAGGVTLAGETDFDGIGTLALAAGSSADEFMYQKDVPEVEFPADVDATFLAAGFQDTDHPSSGPVCYDITNDGVCDNFVHPTIAGTNLRWGKMVLGNGFGSELLPVEVPIRTEYFTTNGFVINTADSCTTYDSADMSFSNANGVTLINLTLVGSGTLINGVDDPVNSVLARSTANEIGSADVTIDLTAQDWLQDDVDGIDNLPADGNIYDDDPTSRITWGIFSGPDEFIYIRESANW